MRGVAFLTVLVLSPALSHQNKNVTSITVSLGLKKSSNISEKKQKKQSKIVHYISHDNKNQVWVSHILLLKILKSLIYFARCYFQAF